MVGNFYIALAGEKDRARVLKIIRDHMKPDQRVFVGVISPDRSARRDAGGSSGPRPRGGQVYPARINSARPTTADSRRSATTLSTTRDTAFAKIQGTRGRHRTCGGRFSESARCSRKTTRKRRLRSVALQNAQSILLARRRAEDALRKQSEWLRITLSSIGDAVISTDAEGG